MENAVQSAALIHQPWSAVPPSPSDPLGMVVDRTAREIAGRCRVVCYATQHPGQPPTQPLLGLGAGEGEIRRISAPLDRLLMPLKMLDRLGLGKSGRPFNSTTLYQIGYILKVAQSLRADPCDVVHVHQFPQWVPILRKLNPRLAIVLHMHDNWLTRLDPQRTRQRLREADLVLGVSEHVAQNIREKYPEFANIVHHAYAGIDDIFFNVKRADDPAAGGRLIYAAPISRDNGIGVLVDAFERVREKFPSARLSVVGEEAEPGLINQLRAGLTAATRDAISFKGNLSGLALADQFAQSDIALAPTIGEEPAGVHLLRAMAAGVCPIASKVGAFPELIQPGHTGQLVTPNAPTDLAAAIVSLLQDESGCQAMGQSARAFTQQHFTWPAAADSLGSLYTVAVEDRRQAMRLGK
ncbi:MAG TPA: glycosyltransferase family 4 protein [Tepidisphaeraceae bacterium]|jgi:glycosyltransferase involved in cell wall biosynthesis|nr:glycosyltransferase family 4 protein [Tepidisphaeraceae bacterium]